jgi:hypothetical protein
MFEAMDGKNLSQAAEPGRKKFSRLALFLIFAVSAVVVFAAYWLIPVKRQLVIVQEETGKVLYHTDARTGDTFTVSYRHSVNKSPVEDVFEIGYDHSILLKKTVFRAFGAGIPCEPQEGESFRILDDRMELDNIDRKLDPYLLYVGTVANHEFFKGEERMELARICKPQQTVRFEVRKVPICILMRRDRL